MADPELADARADLLLDGIELLPSSAYARITAFARFAANHAYLSCAEAPWRPRIAEIGSSTPGRTIG